MNARDLPDVSSCLRSVHAGRLLLCLGLFSIFCERAPSKAEFSNVTRSYAGKGTVRYALVGPAYGVTEIRTFDAHTLKLAEKLKFVGEPCRRGGDR